MNPDEIADRLARIEHRLNRLEVERGQPVVPTTTRTAALPAPEPPPVPTPPPLPSPEERPLLITNVLGWGGAIALVLAASYLIQLAIDTGWLTPARQISFAALGGLTLIGAGLVLRRRERHYASLLPAAGIVVLFLSVYGAHLYYALITAGVAAAIVLAICAAAVILSVLFDSDLYAVFAVAGSYSAPFLLESLRGSITDVAIYFSAWGVVFSLFAIWRGRRLIYLLASYLALVSFDVLWKQRAPDQWMTAAVFQTAQFVIFGVGTALYSVRRNAPLDRLVAAAHIPPLLLFYFLQYAILDQHVPDLAPWIAVASLGVVAGIYGVARGLLQKPLPGGELLLWSYLALVFFHAGYVESVPERWAPWVAFVVVPAVALVTLRGPDGWPDRWPVLAAALMIFVVNYGRVIFNAVDSVPGGAWLPVAYALLFYVGYALSDGRTQVQDTRPASLAMGHISLMAGAVHLFDEGIVESAAWGVLGLACLGVSVWKRDRLLAQSSLVLFGLTAAKVLIYDLSSAPSVVRIISLAVLGISFYVAGLLYQRTVGATLKRW